MSAVFLKLLNMSIAAGWLVVAVIVLRLCLKKAPKAIHCALWALVAIRLICPFSLESSFSLIPEEVANGSVVSEWTDDYIDDIDIHHPSSVYYDAAIGAGREPISDGEGGYYVVTKHDQLGEPATIENTVVPVLSWVWLAGVAALLLYAAISFLRIRARVKVSLNWKDNIWRSEQVDSPFILGVFRPKIYLSFGMDEAQMSHVVAHEQAHLSRRDHWWKPLGFILLAVYWFNPLMWVAYVLLCRDIELACDEKVIRDMGAQDKKAYSEALLACSVPRRMIAACPLAFGEVGVKKRIASVLHYKKPAFWILIVALIASISVAVCFMTNPKDAIEGSYHVEGYGIYNGSEYYIVVNDGVELKCTKEQYEQVASLMELFRTGEMEDTPIRVKYEQFLISYKRGTVIELEIPTESMSSAEGIWSRRDTSDPVEMLAYLCQSDLWGDSIEEEPQISVPGNFGPHAHFSDAPENADTLDVAMAKRAFLLMRLYPEEVFYVTWSYPDEGGEQVRREFHADEMSAILSLSSHSQNYETPASAEDVDRLIQFLTIDEKLFLRHATEGNDFSPLLEAQENAVWFTPEDIYDIEYMELVWHDGQRFTPLTGEGYEYIQTRFSSAKEIGATGCPFHSVLYIHRSDGVVGKVLPAEDSCDVFQSDGKYYQFGDRVNPPYYDSNETFYNHFGTSVEELPHYQTSVGNDAARKEELLEVFKNSDFAAEAVITTDCVIATDDAYGLDGVVQYADETGAPWKLAFIRDGVAYLAGLDYSKEYAIASELTYLGNGAVQVYVENLNDNTVHVCTMEYSYDETENLTNFKATTEEYSRLTDEELAQFNEAFEPIVYDKQGNPIGVNPLSGFFSSYYDDVRNLDFEEFMRYFPEDGSFASHAEFEALKTVEAWPFGWVETRDDMPVPIHKYQARIVDMVLKEYAGITTADLDTSDVAYLANYDAFYNYTSDFGPGMFTCTRGEVIGDIVRLYEELETGTDMLTLRKVGDNYQVVAHQCIEGDNAAEAVYG